MTEEQTSELEDIVSRNYWFQDDVVRRHAFKESVNFNIDLDEPKATNIPDKPRFETGL